MSTQPSPGQRFGRFELLELLGRGGCRVRGVRRVEAFPKRATGEDPGELWTGPERMYQAAGFRVVSDDPSRPILAIEFDGGE